jgi:hypothetical protein
LENSLGENTMTSEFLLKLESCRKPNFYEQIESVLDEASLKDFYTALDNRKVSASTLVKVLNEFGIKTSISKINRLRKQR